MLTLAAQDGEYKTFQKASADSLFVRWAPQSWATFEHAIDGNMTLEAFSVSGTDTRPELTLLESRNMKPLAYATWRASLTRSPWDTIALASVHIEQMDASLLEETFLSPEYEDTTEEEFEARWRVSEYALGYDWTAIERSGMGWARPRDAKTVKYLVKVFPTPQGDTLYYSFSLEDFEEPAVPTLNAKFRDRRAELEWRTIDAKPIFFAWHLERSDAGGPFRDVFELPLINDYDTTATVAEPLKKLYHTNRFERNEDSIVFRLRGQDYLGGRSVRYSEARGKGAEDIRFSPLLTRTEQTDSNYAVIYWEFDQETADLVTEFRIVHTDSTDGKYEIAMEGIPPTDRKAVLPMKYRSNFFRVQAVSKQGTVYSSFESLVMAYDVSPPVMPADFTGYIDTNGLAHLSWLVSDEPDLAGFYLFKGNDPNLDLAMITPDHLPGPTHIDSVDMVDPAETVYYQLRALDFRGNGSEFTPVLALKKPDVYPPAPPQIKEVDNNGGAITLSWTTSPSKDVATYQLYKQRMDAAGDYSLIAEWGVADYPGNYRDTLVEGGSAYSYKLRAMDDDGLVSDFSVPVSARLRDFGLRPAIQDLTLAANADERTITVSWTYNQKPREFYLYRGTEDQPVSLLKVLPGNDRMFLDQGIRKGTTYKYLMRAVFPDGKVSPFTNEVMLSLN